jgi:hypothetical protein
VEEVELGRAVLGQLDGVVEGVLGVLREIRRYEDLIDLHVESFVV